MAEATLWPNGSVSALNFSNTGLATDQDLDTFAVTADDRSLSYLTIFGFGNTGYPYSIFDIYVKTAVIITTDGNDPYVVLSYSNNGGISWKTAWEIYADREATLDGPYRVGCSGDSVFDSVLVKIESFGTLTAANTAFMTFYGVYVEAWYNPGNLPLFNSLRNRT